MNGITIKSVGLLMIGIMLSMGAFVFRKDRCRGLYGGVLCLYLLLISVFSTDAADLNVNRWVYESYPSILAPTAPLFDLVHNTFCWIGLPFWFFKLVCAAFTIVGTYSIFRKYSKYRTVAMGFFLIYPFISTVSQMRNAIAATIVLSVLVEYIISEKHSKLKYTVGILIACMIHYSAVVYLVFLIADHHRAKKNILTITGVLLILELVLINSNLLYNIASSVLPERFAKWLDFSAAMTWAGNPDNYNFLGKVMMFAGWGIFSIAFWEICRNMTKAAYVLDIPVDSGRATVIECVTYAQQCIILLAVCVPLIMLTPTYYRLVKNLWPLMYLMGANYLYYTEYYLNPDSSYILRKSRRVMKNIILVGLVVAAIASYSQESVFQLLNSFGVLP